MLSLIQRTSSDQSQHATLASRTGSKGSLFGSILLRILRPNAVERNYSVLTPIAVPGRAELNLDLGGTVQQLLVHCLKNRSACGVPDTLCSCNLHNV